MNGLIQEIKLKYSNKIFHNKSDRISYWVGRSYLKELDTIELFDTKHMIEDMEAELTEASDIN